MRSILFAAVGLAGVVSLIACTAPTQNEAAMSSGVTPTPIASTDTSGEDDGEDSPPPSSSSSALTPVPVVPAAADIDAGAAASSDAGAAPSGTVTTKTQTCTSATDGYTSVATVTYTVDETDTVRITNLSLDVTNPAGRDKNDVDVYVTPAGGKEAKAFNSGDILTHGEDVAVPQATALIMTTGSSLRLSTNFDKEFAADPSASCSILF